MEGMLFTKPYIKADHRIMGIDGMKILSCLDNITAKNTEDSNQNKTLHIHSIECVVVHTSNSTYTTSYVITNHPLQWPLQPLQPLSTILISARLHA